MRLETITKKVNTDELTYAIGMFEEINLNENVLKYNSKYYLLKEDKSTPGKCWCCKMQKKCERLILVNLAKQTKSVPCFKGFEAEEIKNKKKILELALNKDYFEYTLL